MVPVPISFLSFCRMLVYSFIMQNFEKCAGNEYSCAIAPKSLIHFGLVFHFEQDYLQGDNASGRRAFVPLLH